MAASSRRGTITCGIGTFQIPGRSAAGHVAARKRLFKPAESTSEVAIRMRPNEDLYVNFGACRDNQRAVIRLSSTSGTWVWVGGLVLIGGR